MKLDKKTVRLVALGAAVGANCSTCLETNFAKALENGATEEEIAEAVEIGKKVRSCAASKMDELASGLGRLSAALGTNGPCGCEEPAPAGTGGQNG